MEHYSSGWATVKEDIVPWLTLYIVFSVVMSFTGGLGFILLPNLFRACRKALAEGTSPEIGDMFNFDHLTDDLVGMLLKSVADFVGTLACGIGAIATSLVSG